MALALGQLGAAVSCSSGCAARTFWPGPRPGLLRGFCVHDQVYQATNVGGTTPSCPSGYHNDDVDGDGSGRVDVHGAIQDDAEDEYAWCHSDG